MLAAVCLLGGLLAKPASANMLNLPLNNFPDIMSDSIGVSYNATSGAFDAFGFAETYKSGPLPGQSQTLFPYDFHISAVIHSDGTLGNGTLSIYNDSTPSVVLLSGDLTKVGFSSGNPTMEFLFNNLDGSLHSVYNGLAGVELGFSGVQFGSTGNVLVSFSNMNSDGIGDGTSDTKSPVSSVPEPSTISLLLFGLLGAGALYRFRASKLS